MEGAAKALENAGAELVEVDLPNIKSAIAAYYVMRAVRGFSRTSLALTACATATRRRCLSLAEQTSRAARARRRGAKRRQMLGAYLLSSGVCDKYYYPAQQVRTLITQDYKGAYEQCDVILMPASPRTAFKFGEMSDPTQMYASDMFTISNNIAGNGGISVPLGLGTESHLPVSVQLQGPAFSDRKLLRFARAVEKSFSARGAVAPEFAGKGGEL